MLGEFAAETRGMTLAETGAYVRLKDAYWQETVAGREIPATDESLARYAAVDINQWLTVKVTVMARFAVTVTVTDSVLRHERDFSRIQEAQRNYSARKSASDKANAAKALRDGDRDRDRDGDRDGVRDGAQKKNIESINNKRAVDKSGTGETATNRKQWYREELGRLDREFGPLANLLKSECQRPDKHGAYGYVETFRGARFERGQGSGSSRIIMPTAERACEVNERHQELISMLCDGRLLVCGPDRRPA